MTEPVADLSRIPQVDALLREADEAIATFGRRQVVAALRRTLDDVRRRAREGRPLPDADEIIARTVADLDARSAPGLRAVLNATGVVLHTNLGRAPLSAEARAAMVEASGYATLEYDLDAGQRGSRTAHVGRLLAEACGAEAATAVNNGAAALVLVLSALCAGRPAVVSRGELVEIGGSFRLPDVMAASGAILSEVGTTNRTRLDDYRRATDEGAGLVLKVHRSNYQVVGFATEPRLGELVELAHRADVPLVYDLGSGLLRPTPGFDDEPAATTALAAGADLVVFSGDKLLGGPQAGVVAGRADLVRRCARHPLARALRLDKFRLAALEVTVAAHLRADVPMDVPVWAMLHCDEGELRARAERLAASVDGVSATELRSLTGGGSLPGVELASWGLRVDDERPDQVAAALRRGEPPVIARVEDGALVLDLRTVPPVQDERLVQALRAALT